MLIFSPSLCKMCVSRHGADVVVNLQVSSVSAVCGREFAVPAGESDVCSAGEDERRAGQGRGSGARRHQRLALRPLRRLAVRLPLQGGQDVARQHLPGVQGKKRILITSHYMTLHSTQILSSFTHLLCVTK